MERLQDVPAPTLIAPAVHDGVGGMMKWKDGSGTNTYRRNDEMEKWKDGKMERGGIYLFFCRDDNVAVCYSIGIEFPLVFCFIISWGVDDKFFAVFGCCYAFFSCLGFCKI